MAVNSVDIDLAVAVQKLELREKITSMVFIIQIVFLGSKSLI